jgi:hypothetical protein
MTMVIVERDRVFAQRLLELARACEVRAEWAATAGQAYARAQRTSIRGFVACYSEDSVSLVRELARELPRLPVAVLAPSAGAISTPLAEQGVTIIGTENDWEAALQSWMRQHSPHGSVVRAGNGCAEIASTRSGCGFGAATAE